MTTALYRRYRPDTFQEVIGQEHVTEPLMAALRADRVTHAYLFSGPRGCGKTTSARILARCLNCAQGPTDTPCGVCESCVDLARGGSGSLDVVEIDAASHGGVDDARELRERATFAPARDRYKVFIIDEAHMVSTQGFNALLKLVEEPPEHVKFIFATTEPEKVIGTIRSRTHHYPFRLVPPETLEEYLAKLCAEEGVEVGGGVFPLVVRAGGGSVRDTLSVLDQLVAGAIDGQVDYHRAAALLGYTDAALLDGVTDAIGARDGAALFTAVDRVVQSGHDPRRFVEDLLQRLRDLVVLAVAGDAAIHALTGLPADRLERMRAQSEHIGAWRLSRAADLTNEALSEMSGTTSPRLQLELLCARILLVGEGGAAGGGSAAEGRSGQGDAVGGYAGPADAPAGSPAPGGPPPRLRVQDSRVRPPETGARRVDDAAARDRDRAAGPEQQRAAGPGERAAGADRTPPGAPDRTPPAAPPPRDAEPERAAEPAPGPDRPQQGAPHGEGDAQMVHERWNEVVAQMRSVYLRSLVGQHARPGELTGGALRVDFTNPTLAGHFDGRDGAAELAAALFEVLGLQVRVVTGVGGADTPAPAAMGGWSAEPPQRGPGEDRRARDQRDAGRQPATQPDHRPENRGQQPHRGEAAPSGGARPDGRDGRRAGGERSRGGGAGESADDAEGDSGWPTVAVPGGPIAAVAAVSAAPADGPDAGAPAAEDTTAEGAAADGGADDADPRPAQDAATGGATAQDDEPRPAADPRSAQVASPAHSGGDARSLAADDPDAEDAPTSDPGPTPRVDPDAAPDVAPDADAAGSQEPGTERGPHPAEADDSWVTEPPADDDPHGFAPAEVHADPEDRRLSRSLAQGDEDDVRPGGAETPDTRGASGPLEDADSPVTPGVPVPPDPAPTAEPAEARRPWERFATGADAPIPVASDDDVSMDDVDAEDSGLVGVPVLQQMLGGVVIEERTTTDEREVR